MDLCLFIRGTGLLNLCWFECLGLHNKRKAEVHPGHKLTGPKDKEEEEYHYLQHIINTHKWYIFQIQQYFAQIIYHLGK
jgi:hypothetical protein